METKRVTRRKHSAEFRAQVVRACREPDASVAAIALRMGLNANLVHRWLTEDGRGRDGGVGKLAPASAGPAAEFMPVQLPPAAVAALSSEIRVEVRRGASIITVNWPLAGAGDCAAWLRDWLR